MLSFKQDYKESGNNRYYGINTETNAISYGGKLGYKYFFNPYVGIRGYVNVDYQEGYFYSVVALTKGNSSSNNAWLSFLGFGVNADVLINFYNSSSLNAGLFAGLQIGGIKTDFRLDQLIDNYLSFDSNFRIGARINVAQNHGVELGAKIPLIDAKRNEDYLNFGVKTTQKARQLYIINLSYIYTF